MKKLRLMIADDHKIVRDGMRALVAQVPEWEFVGETDNELAHERITPATHEPTRLKSPQSALAITLQGSCNDVAESDQCSTESLTIGLIEASSALNAFWSASSEGI